MVTVLGNFGPKRTNYSYQCAQARKYSLLALRFREGVFGEIGNLRARAILEVYVNPPIFAKSTKLHPNHDKFP